jgi:hypothetical protein
MGLPVSSWPGSTRPYDNGKILPKTETRRHNDSTLLHQQLPGEQDTHNFLYVVVQLAKPELGLSEGGEYRQASP